MANRTKKDASEALSQLQKYLYRDPHACQLLKAVSRYQGDLRQKCAQLKTETTTLADARGVTLLRNAALMTKTQTLQRALDKEKSMTNQLRCDVSQMQARIGRLEKELEPPSLESEGDTPDDLREDITALKKLVKHLQRRMSRAPSLRRVTTHRTAVIDLRKIVTSYSGDQYTTVGMFVTLSAMMGFRISFEWDVPGEQEIRKLRSHKEYERTVGGYIRWVRGWIGEAEWQKQLIERSEPVQPGGRGDLPRIRPEC